ncbi:hypothetical protein C464_00129 [Halorubrum coriense DSM 10284]|uniref:Uncharacterized protein n=1 Tax=Halorubrum coriense DSM 10284 TaxID=1227466 RepID=M0EXZ7_9EURY|nr:hypothetical protein [Halorubrum coriense]ELZ51757.1 hypothetical protein C464_00129 [Halorubrum coriense DSM 10284]
MGLRCLLGHDFGEPELRREREEEGDEVVTTVREVKTCARCGETQIVSENTEVTTMEQLADEAAANAGGRNDAGAAATPADRDAAGSAEGPATPGASSRAVGADDATPADDGLTLDEEPGAGSDDAVIIDDGAADDATGATDAGPSPNEVEEEPESPEQSSAASEADSAAGPGDEDAELLGAGGESTGDRSAASDAPAESAASDETDAESDDGVILDDEEEAATGDRERGAWPSVDEADAAGDGRAAWPDHGGEDEGFSAEIGESGEAGVEFGGGLTPEAAERREGEPEETEYVEAPDDGETVAFDAGEDETGITRGESPDLDTTGTDEPTEYYCPECGMVRAADGSSMRAGDICPECKRGYVDERPR